MIAPLARHALPATAPAILGSSPKLLRALELAERYAGSDLPVLLVGETGTGKELFAQHIHQRSRRPGELVDVNCGALPREMVESLLFGHARGAFTGAHADAAGLVARAARGTLFLDELSSLPLEAQAKLLRVIETGEVRRLGDTAKRRVEFRVVAAVQRDLPRLVESGAFRRDLYHRVAALVIQLPALRERPEDLESLAAHFAVAQGCALAPGAAAVLGRHGWPGNVRELRAVIARAALGTPDGLLGGAALAEAIGLQETLAQGADDGHAGSVAPADTARLLELCAEAEWDPRRIAASLGVSRATCYRRLKAHGISLRSIAPASQPSSRSHASHPSRAPATAS